MCICFEFYTVSCIHKLKLVMVSLISVDKSYFGGSFDYEL